MGQQDAFAPGRSDLYGFLSADIGLEDSGMPMSVISAPARQRPYLWLEARRPVADRGRPDHGPAPALAAYVTPALAGPAAALPITAVPAVPIPTWD